MRIGSLLLRSLFLAEFAIFVPGLPTIAEAVAPSVAALAYLLILGVFAGLAAWSFASGKPMARVWAWGAAATNLPVFPMLTPVGVLMGALLFAMDRNLSGARRRRLRLSSTSGRTPVELPALNGAIVPIGLALCWSGAWSIHRFAQVSGLPPLGAFSAFLGLWLMVPVCAAVHQAGHWLASERSGIRTMADWSGWLDLQTAATDRKGLRKAMFQTLLGGPLASLACGAVLLAVLLFSPGSDFAEMGELAGLAGVVSLVIAALSILPWRLAGYRSDGAALLSLVTGDEGANRDVCLSLLGGMWMQGARPRDWDPRWLRAAVSSPDLSRSHATGCALNYLHAIDKGYQSTARYWLVRIAEEFAEDREAVPARWQLEVAYFLARHDQSSRYADALAWRLAAGRCAGVPRYVTLRADSAIALAEGNMQRAAELADLAEIHAHGFDRTGMVELEFDLLAGLPRPEKAPVLAMLPLQPAQPAAAAPAGQMLALASVARRAMS